MLFKEAKEFLNSNGYQLIDESNDYEEKTIELLESEKLQKLARELQKFTFEGKPAFPIQRYGEVFNRFKHAFMIRIQLPNSTSTGTFIDIDSDYEIHYRGTTAVDEGWSGSSMGYFWYIVKTLETLGLLKNWTKLFRSEKKYSLDTLIPFLKDLLKVWDEDFYAIVSKFSHQAEEEAIAADIANYKGRNWSGD